MPRPRSQSRSTRQLRSRKHALAPSSQPLPEDCPAHPRSAGPSHRLPDLPRLPTALAAQPSKAPRACHDVHPALRAV
eukprot:6594424-Alexandrium_andersonii.AAC.1